MNINGPYAPFESNEDEFNEIFRFLKPNEPRPESRSAIKFDIFKHDIDRRSTSDECSLDIERPMTSTSTLFSYNDDEDVEILDTAPDDITLQWSRQEEREQKLIPGLMEIKADELNVEDQTLKNDGLIHGLVSQCGCSSHDAPSNTSSEWSRHEEAQSLIPQLMNIKVDESRVKVHILKNNKTQVRHQNKSSFGRQSAFSNRRMQRNTGEVLTPNMLRTPSAATSNTLYLVDGNPNSYHNAYRQRSYSETTSRRSQMRPRQLSISEDMTGCGYCRALGIHDFTNHSKKNCMQLQLLPPCKCCNASGADNHTETYCPRKQPVYLDLCPNYLSRWNYRNSRSSYCLTGFLQHETYAEWKKSESD